MTQTPSAQVQEIRDIQNRLQWFDEERRKSGRRLAEMEQRLEAQDREISARDQRIQTLEEQLAAARARINSFADLDTRFRQQREELLEIIQKSEQQKRESDRETEMRQQIERNNLTREIADIRKQLPIIPRMQADIEQRKAEDARLITLIGTLQNQLTSINSQIDTLTTQTTYSDEQNKLIGRQLAQNDTALVELARRTDAAEQRVEQTSFTVGRYESILAEAARVQTTLDRQVKERLDQLRAAEFERNQRVKAWEEAFNTYQSDMARFHQEMLRYGDQIKEAKATVQTLPPWREQIERQQRELSELLRVEQNRLVSRWEAFRAENEKFWTTVRVDMDQRLSAADRRQRTFDAQISDVDTQIKQLRLDKERSDRIFVAQTEAIKRIPALWMEEVEKAVENDPNRRRQTPFTPTPDNT